MKRLTIFALLITLMAVFTAQTALADDPKAREIMEKVDARNDGDKSVSDMKMILIDKNGKERIREIRTYMLDKGADSQRIMFFQSPADVKDTGFLTYDYDDPDKDDDQWLYLPALKKSKRIASSDKSGSFMGSDLTYADMTSRDLDDYDFTMKRESIDVYGKDAWVIESTPRNREVIEETGYTRSFLFVYKHNYVLVRAIHDVKDGGYTKYFDVKDMAEIDGIWTNREIHMTKKKGKATVHSTILKFENTRYNQPEVTEDMFTLRRLEKGL